MKTLGIDLGTTNTVVAHQGQPLAAPTESSPEAIVPSAVAYPPTGAPLVGARARSRRSIDPENTILSAKRLIGERFTSTRQAQLQPYYAPTLVDASGTFAFRTRAGLCGPEDVSTQIVQHALARAGLCPETLDGVVVTVPSSFHVAQRAATVEAVRRAGIERVGVIEEPVATAVGYLQRSGLRYAAVYDLGGGTFDLAVIDCEKHPFRVLAHVGDPFLGGDDIDRALACYVAERVLREHHWDLGNDRQTFARLVSACEWAKRSLSKLPQVGIPIGEIDEAAPPSIDPVPLDRERLREISDPFVHRTFGLCDQVLGRAELRAQDIQAVFLAGGSSRLPGLTTQVEAYFGKRPRQDIDPNTVVAVGASFVASRDDLRRMLDLPVSRRQSQPEIYAQR